MNIERTSRIIAHGSSCVAAVAFGLLVWNIFQLRDAWNAHRLYTDPILLLFYSALGSVAVFAGVAIVTGKSGRHWLPWLELCLASGVLLLFAFAG